MVMMLVMVALFVVMVVMVFATSMVVMVFLHFAGMLACCLVCQMRMVMLPLFGIFSGRYIHISYYLQSCVGNTGDFGGKIAQYFLQLSCKVVPKPAISIIKCVISNL